MALPNKIAKIVASMSASPSGVRFEDVRSVCDWYFGVPRQSGTSHAVYKMPWAGDPRVNIQRGSDGKAKGYQVKTILYAIEKLSVSK